MLLSGIAANPSPWLVAIGIGTLILAAWLCWQQRALLRQRWQAAYEELQKLY